MDAFMIRLLEMTITAGICAAAVGVIRLLFRRLPARFMGILWLVVLFRLLCPVSFELPLRGADSISNAIFERAEAPNDPDRVITVTPSGAESLATPAIPPVTAPAAPLVPDSSMPEPWESRPVYMVPFFVWLGGAALMLGFGAANSLLLWRRLRLAAKCPDGTWELAGLPGPFVFGFLRPRIFLPPIPEGEERQYIIAHERVHIKRLDHITKPLFYAALCLHWFNPLVWIAFFLMGRDLERACDEKVVDIFGPGIKKSYSGSLLGFASGKMGLTPLAFGEENVKGRIKNLLRYKKPGLAVTLCGIAAAAILAVFLAANSGGGKESSSLPPVTTTTTAAPSQSGPLSSSAAVNMGGTTLPRATTAPTRPPLYTTTVNKLMDPENTPDKDLQSLTLDGKDLGPVEGLYRHIGGLIYLNARVIGEKLGFEVVCASGTPVEHSGVTVAPSTLAVFYGDYVTTMTCGDTYALTYRIGEPEILHFPLTASAPVEMDGEIYIDPCLLPYLFFVKEDIYRIWVPEELGLISLDAQIKKAEAYAREKGYTFEATGDPFYDRYIFRETFLASRRGSTAVFDMNVDRMLMGPVLGELLYSDFGWLWKVDGKYGLYVHSFGNISIEPRYDSIRCLNFRSRIFLLERNGLYTTAHCPTGMDQVTFLIENSETIPTVGESIDKLHSMGLTGGGEWRSVMHAPEYELTPDGLRSTGSLPDVTFDHPFEWTVMGETMLGELIPWEGSAMARMEIGYVIKISPQEYGKKADELYSMVFYGEKPLSEERIQSVTTNESGEQLRKGGEIRRYVMGGNPFKTRWFVYDAGYLVTFTTYGSYDADHWENAVFLRMMTSVDCSY